MFPFLNILMFVHNLELVQLTTRLVFEFFLYPNSEILLGLHATKCLHIQGLISPAVNSKKVLDHLPEHHIS